MRKASRVSCHLHVHAMIYHVDHMFYCKSKKRAEEIKELLSSGPDYTPEDFPDEYAYEAEGIAFFECKYLTELDESPIAN